MISSSTLIYFSSIQYILMIIISTNVLTLVLLGNVYGKKENLD